MCRFYGLFSAGLRGRCWDAGAERPARLMSGDLVQSMSSHMVIEPPILARTMLKPR